MAYEPSAFSGEEPEEEYEGQDLSVYKGYWAEAVDSYTEPRTQHYRDEEYYDGDVKGTGWGHWTTTQLEKLGMRGQPPTTRNVIQRMVNAISGVEGRGRSEPRALPRTPRDQQSAEIATDALRFIKDRTRWENKKANSFLEALKVGFAAVEIQATKDSVNVEPIEWKDFFFDPRSRRDDFSDARYLGVAKWLDKEVALATYAGPQPREPQPVPPPQIPPQPADPRLAQQWAAIAQQMIGEYQQAQAQAQAQYEKDLARWQQITETINNTANGNGSTGAMSESQFDDRPSNVFCDAKRLRVFVIDMWHKDPQRGWFRCVFTGAGKLFTEEATFVERDEWGREVKVHPIVAFSLYVSRDLWRYGFVRGMRSPQDEMNFRLSKMLHWLTFNQLFYEPGALGATDKEVARTEMARPDGAIEVGSLQGIKVERGLDVAAALANASQDAREFMEMSGPNPQLQGEQGRATSGRAVLALQQAGLGLLGPIFDRLYDWELRCYRAMWFRVQQFWTGPMYVRVTDDRNAARFAAVNGAPVIMDDNGSEPAPDDSEQIDPRMGIGGNNGPPMTPEDMGPMGAPSGAGGMGMMPGQPPAPSGSPQDQQTGPMLAELDMDIIIDRAPEAATLQAEQFESLTQLAQGGVFGPPGNPDVARLLVTASASPEKTKLLEIVDKMEKSQGQPNPQQMALLKKLEAEVANLVAKKQKTDAETAKLGAQIPGEQAGAALTAAEAHDAETTATVNRLGATHMLSQGIPLMPADAAALAPHAVQAPQAPPQPQAHPPSVSISYKDAPPDVRREMELAAGFMPSRVGDPPPLPPAPPRAPQPR